MNFTDYSSSATASLLPFGCSRVAYLRQVVGSLHVGRCSVPGHVKTLSLRSSFSSEPLTVNGLIDFLFLSINRAAAMASQASTWASAKVIDGKLVTKEIKKDSATYVRNKKKACESVGINSFEVCLPEDSAETEVLKYISDFNDDPAVHGILVQLPLPKIWDSNQREESSCDWAEQYRRHARCSIASEGGCYCYYGALKDHNPEKIVKEADIVISAVGQPDMVRGSWLKL
ncbi:Bifunctional protein FolD 4, chloroplastic [Linum perenne]